MTQSTHQNLVTAVVSAAEGAKGSNNIAFAGGKSAASFGASQSDIGGNASNKAALSGILVNGGMDLATVQAATDVLSQNGISKNTAISQLNSKGLDGNAVLNNINTILNSDVGKQAVAGLDNANFSKVAASLDQAISKASENAVGPGVLSDSHPDFQMAAGLLAAWANRTGGLDQFNNYVKTLGRAPTLNDVTDYLRGQKQFRPKERGGRGEDFDAWRGRVQDGVQKYQNPDYPPSTEPPAEFPEEPSPPGKIPSFDPSHPDSDPSSPPSWLPGFGEGELRLGSPIIFDLDGDGVETAAVTAGAYFDHAADGFAEQTGWVGGGDGLLVRDIDGDGRIDSGRELFGNETLLADGVTKAANGFAALAVLDSNTDGKVDANDAAWQELKVWIDADGDGYSQTDELFTLEQVGVASVNTGFTTSTTVDANGNAHKQIGSFTRSDGTIAAAEDVWFASNPTFSFAEEWVTVSPEIAVLPDAKGYGKVYDLHQAMARDSSGHLQTLLNSYVAATDNATRASLVEQILYAWTGTEEVSTTGRGPNFDGRKIQPKIGFFRGSEMLSRQKVSHAEQ